MILSFLTHWPEFPHKTIPALAGPAYPHVHREQAYALFAT
jgi:hypothetical protein